MGREWTTVTLLITAPQVFEKEKNGEKQEDNQSSTSLNEPANRVIIGKGSVCHKHKKKIFANQSSTTLCYFKIDNIACHMVFFSMCKIHVCHCDLSHIWAS